MKLKKDIPLPQSGRRQCRIDKGAGGGREMLHQRYASLFRLAWASALTGASFSAHASFLAGETLDTAADILAIFVLFFVPVVAVAVFWLVHILPEKVAEKRHHPQKAAITTLCLLSLVFGGMLWPLAWLWAYVKPVGYKMAYGTDKHDDYFREAGEQAQKGELPAETIETIRTELARLETSGLLSPELRVIYEQLNTSAKPQHPGQPEQSGSAV